ncbi:MAG: T9SS type A sorting domain-containing protein, partial [Bacteroidota bacterium]|nr:T9SS type A sorting domain-containing protein [Bacteroidota bacterium]
TFAGPDLFYCPGGDPVQLSVTGGNSFTWSPSSGLSCTNCPNPNATPSSTTQYIVTSNLSSSSCKNIDTVIVNVVPIFPVTMNPASATICQNGSVQLLASTQSTYAPYTYSWSPATGLSSTTIANPIANPMVTTTYTVTIISADGCERTMSVPITVSGIAPISSATATPTMVCPGEPVQLEASTQSGNCAAAITPCSSTSLATLGTGTASNTSTGFPAVYGNFYWGSKHQYLILGSELQAMGLTSGKIRSLAFDVSAMNTSTSTYNAFRIGMKCTNATALTVAETGFTTVFPAQNVTVSTGWNTHNFSTHYEWDGVSNIVVEVCFNNSSYTNNASTRYTPTTFTSVMYNIGDNSTVCSATPSTTNTWRPNMRFGYCIVPPSSSLTFSWSPATNLSNPNIYNPIATPSLTTTYTVSISDGGCVGNASVTIETDNTNSVIAYPNPDTTACAGDPVQLNAAFLGPQPTGTLNCGTNNTTCVTSFYNATLGTGTSVNSTTSYPAIYGNWYWGARHQILYRATELTAAGLSSGTINQIAFDISAIAGTSTYNNFTIKMGCSSLTTLGSTWVTTGMQTVYSVPSWSVVTGWNQHNLTSPFDWDGTSNIIIEVCFNNSSYTSNSSTRFTNVGYNAVSYYRSDISNVCSDNSSFITNSMDRPNTRFRVCNALPGTLTYSWSPSTGLSNPNIANPVATVSTNTTYVVNVTGGVCPVVDSTTIYMCNVLPIELLSFTGKKADKENHLFWATESEINNDFFNVERSVDAEKFILLGKIKAAGTSHVTTDYRFIDKKPIDGINYYRLKQTDFDGTVSYSEIIPLENRSKQIVYNIYPNPSAFNYNLDLKSPVGGTLNIEVIDTYGRIILIENKIVDIGSTTMQINARHWAQGIYILKLSMENTEYSETSRIVKY